MKFLYKDEEWKQRLQFHTKISYKEIFSVNIQSDIE